MTPDFRKLPAVHVLAARPELAASLRERGREVVSAAAREAIEAARESLRADPSAEIDVEALVRDVARRLDADRPNLRAVINGTGILLNTGLGRAPLAEEAIRAVAEVCRGYSNLEFDLESGERGDRVSGVSRLLGRVTGAEAATVVNNNAAATVLALKALAQGREVVVSRGELVEIGGSFRLPEIFEVAGVRLREVGTTNKTRLSDYERAIGPETAALLRVHPSNYRVVGFTESAPIDALVRLAREKGLWCIDDIGSGALARDVMPESSDEPTIAESLAAGADLVLCSGDKLLGGPQCGLIAGRKAAVDRVARDPLMRAMRVDKMTLAALEATLRLAAVPSLARERIPLRRFLATDPAALLVRAERLAERLREAGVAAEAVPSEAMIGGGSLPAERLPSAAVRLTPPSPGATELAGRLRLGTPSVVPRIHAGAVLIDLRAVSATEDDGIVAAVSAAVRD